MNKGVRVGYTQSSLVSPSDETVLATYAWAAPERPRGVVQIAHGLAEHGARYDRLAQALVEAGYAVHAVDHRGHGHSTTPEGRGDFGPAGFVGVAADIAAFGQHLAETHGGLPLFLVAHSMGSIAGQEAILDHSERYAGVVFSGSTAVDALAQALAAAPEGGPSGLEAFNVGFEHRTGFEWLSRDAAEVDAYVADPLCGFDLPDDALPQLLARGARLADPEELRNIRPDLPLLLISGERDPIAGGGALVELLGHRYREAGVRDVTVRLYPEARHEIFNETNRAEVTRDVIAWLDGHC